MKWKGVPLGKKTNKQKTILKPRELPHIYFWKTRTQKRGEKHLGLGGCHISISLPKKPKSKSKLRNTPNGLLSQLPLFQFSLWRLSARVTLRALAEIIKSERISILMSRGYSDKLVWECCAVNKGLWIGMSRSRLRCCVLSCHVDCLRMLQTESPLKKRFLLITMNLFGLRSTTGGLQCKDVMLGDGKWKRDLVTFGTLTPSSWGEGK